MTNLQWTAQVKVGLLLDENEELTEKWTQLGFISFRQMQLYLEDEPAYRHKTYGYIHVQLNEVIYGQIGMYEADTGVGGMIIMLDDSCDSVLKDGINSNEKVLHFPQSSNFLFYHKDIELLTSIKDKFIEVYKEAESKFSDRLVSRENYFLSEMISYIKKLNRKAKHD